MSLKTWKEEFYPIPAHKTKKRDAAEHSLQKWRGLLPSSLKRHRVIFDYQRITVLDEDYFYFGFNEATCSLCYHYLSGAYNICENCPLFQITGRSCTTSKSKFNDVAMGKRGAVREMIQALKKAVNRQRKIL